MTINKSNKVFSIQHILLTLLLFQCSHCFQSESQQKIFQSWQYHFIPEASYFQFSIATAQLNDQRFQSFSLINGSLDCNIQNTQKETIKYNFLIFPDSAPEDSSFYILQCFARAALEGLQYQNCDFKIVTGNCNKCVQQAIYSNITTACVGCLTNVSVSIFSDQSHKSAQGQQILSPNSTMLFIIDNTNVIAETGSYMQMSLQYNLSMYLNTNQISVIILFISLMLFSIVVIIALSTYLTYKAKNLKKKISQYVKRD